MFWEEYNVLLWKSLHALSLQQAVVSHAMEVAHHLHHHLHHQPPPFHSHPYPAPCLAPPTQMVYPDDCVHTVYHEAAAVEIEIVFLVFTSFYMYDIVF